MKMKLLDVALAGVLLVEALILLGTYVGAH